MQCYGIVGQVQFIKVTQQLCKIISSQTNLNIKKCALKYNKQVQHLYAVLNILELRSVGKFPTVIFCKKNIKIENLDSNQELCSIGCSYPKIQSLVV